MRAFGLACALTATLAASALAQAGGAPTTQRPATPPTGAQPAAAVDTSAPLPQEIATIQVGQNRTGMLEVGDFQMGDGTWCDVWYVNASAGQRLVIELRSRAFDSYLQLLDPWGTRLAEDDDSASGHDSRIVFAARDAGRYQVVVNNHDEDQHTGTYVLSLR